MTFDELPFEVDDSAEQRVVVIEREPRPCKHPKGSRLAVHFATDEAGAAEGLYHVAQVHPVPFDCEPGQVCVRCHHQIRNARSRRGRTSRNRGNAFEREVAAKLGGVRKGQFGGPEDILTPMFSVQTKKYATARFPRWMSDELAKLSRTEGRTPILIVGEAAGSGRRGRALVVVELSDWIALHGEVSDATR